MANYDLKVLNDNLERLLESFPGKKLEGLFVA